MGTNCYKPNSLNKNSERCFKFFASNIYFPFILHLNCGFRQKARHDYALHKRKYYVVIVTVLLFHSFWTSRVPNGCRIRINTHVVVGLKLLTSYPYSTRRIDLSLTPSLYRVWITPEFRCNCIRNTPYLGFLSQDRLHVYYGDTLELELRIIRATHVWRISMEHAYPVQTL